MPKPDPSPADVPEVSLDELIQMLKSADSAMAAGPKGACLTRAPDGSSRCVRTTETACKGLGGTWIGGPCGGP